MVGATKRPNIIYNIFTLHLNPQYIYNDEEVNLMIGIMLQEAHNASTQDYLLAL